MWTIWGYLNCLHVFVAVFFSLLSFIFNSWSHTPLPLRNEWNFIKSSDVAPKLFHYFIYSSLCCFAEIRLVIIFYSILFHFWVVKLSKWNDGVCVSLSLSLSVCVCAWIYFSWLIEWLNKITIHVYAWVFLLRMPPIYVSVYASVCLCLNAFQTIGTTTIPCICVCKIK